MPAMMPGMSARPLAVIREADHSSGASGFRRQNLSWLRTVMAVSGNAMTRISAPSSSTSCGTRDSAEMITTNSSIARVSAARAGSMEALAVETAVVPAAVAAGVRVTGPAAAPAAVPGAASAGVPAVVGAASAGVPVAAPAVVAVAAPAVVPVVASLVVSPSMWSRLIETATNSRPVSAAAAPVTAVKKPTQAAGSYPCIGAAPVDEVLLVVRLYLDAGGLGE